MKNNIQILIGLALIFAFNGAAANAQENTATQKRNDRLRNGYLKQLSDQRDIAKARMDNRLADISAATELTEAQNRRLTIAAKGALRSYSEKADQEMISKAKRLGFDLDTTMEFDAKIGQTYSRTRPRSVVKAVESESIWTGSVEKVLTEEQKIELKEWADKRSAIRREIALDLFIARVDESLLLSIEQREQLRKQIDARYGEQLSSNLERQFSSSRGSQRNKPADTAYLKELLTESQLTAWQSAFAAEVTRLNADKGAGNPRAAVNEKIPFDVARPPIIRRAIADGIEVKIEANGD